MGDRQLKKKICMVGSYAVGKTSLVERFVHSLYSDAYHTTIGVKIDKKAVEMEEVTLTCIIWDIAGEDEFYTVQNSYLRGMAGFFLVLDGTRSMTLKVASTILDRVQETYPDVPFILLINKADLKDAWELSEEDLARISDRATAVIHTSAKTGMGVEEAFEALAGEMVAGRQA